MRFNTSAQWLAWQESLHPREIDMGLARTRAVAERMGLMRLSFPIVTVAGTNGKGSSVALVERIARAAGLRVGRFMSPHLLHYHERIAVAGKDIAEADLCQAFAAVDAARCQGEEISLTYFEFGALAAMAHFRAATVDLAVLEVGLGGRLDAVNVFDADVALITAIGLDHQQWLGHNREAIGREKAGILRPGRPAVCSDPQPPASIAQTAHQVGARLWQLGSDFNFSANTDTWHWHNAYASYHDLPLPRLVGAHQMHNAAGALQALQCLAEPLGVNADFFSWQAIQEGLREVFVAGRLQRLPGAVPLYVDVAHNPHAAAALARALTTLPAARRTLAVAGMLNTKDITGTFGELHAHIDVWYIAEVKAVNAAPVADMAAALHKLGAAWHEFPTITAATHAALTNAAPACPPDRVLVFGSFYTVAEVLR